MKSIICFFLSISLSCLGENVLVLFYRDLPDTNVWEKLNGIPPLCIADSRSTLITSIPPGWSTNWTREQVHAHSVIMAPQYQSWYSQVKASEQASFLTNIVILRNQFASNQVFLGNVATNRPAVTTLALSNQTVTISRILNQIRPLLSDMYKGDQ